MGSNRLLSSSTNAATAPTLTEPRWASQPPTPTISATANTLTNSMKPKYHTLMRTAWRCDP